jgi:hypothetical protein
LSLTFELIRKFAQGNEKTIAKFSDKLDAVNFMKFKAREDVQMKITTEYNIRHDDEIIDRIISTDFGQPLAQTSNTTTSSGSSFNPNPFSTTAQPAGLKSSFTNSKDHHDEDI